MNNEYTAKFISFFFEQLEEQGIKYCILRGYEGLPQVAGRDIDMFLDTDRDICEVVSKIAQSIKWKCYKKLEDDCFYSFVCYQFDNNTQSFIQIDIWTSLNWRGISWLDRKELMNNLRSINGFKVVAPGTEAVICAMKELFGRGVPKEKYYSMIIDNANADKEQFISCLNDIYGVLAVKIWSICANSKCEELGHIKREVRECLIKHNRGLYWKNSILRAKKRVRDFVIPQGKLIVFWGPDGSGKSTIIHEVSQYLEPLFDGLDVYHMNYGILPELRTGHGFSSMKGQIGASISDNSKKVVKRSLVSKLASWVVVLYNAFEFLLGKNLIRGKKRRNHIILYDRYFYDQFTQPTTRELVKPFRKLLIKFASKPNLTVQIKAAPEVVYKRKQELSKQEIDIQNKYITDTLKYVGPSYVAETTIKSISEITQEILIHILETLENDNCVC